MEKPLVNIDVSFKPAVDTDRLESCGRFIHSVVCLTSP
jgi:hypothetical protein